MTLKNFQAMLFFDENEGKEKKIAVKGKTTNEEGLERWLVHSTTATKESIDGHFDEKEYLISAGRIAKALLLDSYELDKRSLLAPKGKFDFGMLKTDLLYHYGKAGLFFSVAGCNKFEPSIIKSQILK